MSTWNRIDGALFGWDEERPLGDFIGYLQNHRILSCVDHDGGVAVRVRFLVDDEERVAISSGSTLASGIDLKDLIEDIALTFDVDAMAGEHEVFEDDDDPHADTEGEHRLPGGDEHGEDHELENAACEAEGCSCEHGSGLRGVTVIPGGMSDVAALARRLDEPIVVLPLHGRNVVLTEEGDCLPSEHDLPKDPTLQVFGLEPDFALLLDSPDAIVSVSWGVTRWLTPTDLDVDAAASLHDLARDREVAELVAEFGGETDAVEAALNPVDGGPDALLASIDLPGAVWEFLTGERAAHEVDDVVVITPPTAGESLSYMVDDVLPETPFVERLEEIERDHPVATRAPSASAILIGGGLAAVGLAQTKGVTRAVLVGIGGVIAVNGIAGLSLTELLRSVRVNRPTPKW